MIPEKPISILTVEDHPIFREGLSTVLSSEPDMLLVANAYRIGYEAIRNTCMHSAASRLEVELRYTHDLNLLVRDNGIGIDAAVVDKGKDGHFGLQGMRERAARIGAKPTLNSFTTSGTETKVVVPGGIAFRKTSSLQQTLFTKIKAAFGR